jgi:hypothetical protein
LRTRNRSFDGLNQSKPDHTGHRKGIQKVSIRLNTVPAKTGWTWVQKGLRTFFRQPLAMAGLFFLFISCVSLLSMIPVAGALLALAITPAFTLGLMKASRQAEAGTFPMPHQLFAALRSEQTRKPMLQLGLLYGLSFLLMLGLSTLMDGGTLFQLYFGQGRPETEEMDLFAVQAAMQLLMALSLPLAFVFWHAPALVYWHGIGPVKSMFFSVMACWRNKAAFFIYCMGWMGVMIAASVLMGLLMSVLGGPDKAGVLVMPVMMVMAAMFFTSLDFTFRDSFVTDDDGATRDNAASSDVSPHE